jgi:hypothetical protein
VIVVLVVVSAGFTVVVAPVSTVVTGAVDAGTAVSTVAGTEV